MSGSKRLDKMSSKSSFVAMLSFSALLEVHSDQDLWNVDSSPVAWDGVASVSLPSFK